MFCFLLLWNQTILHNFTTFLSHPLFPWRGAIAKTLVKHIKIKKTLLAMLFYFYLFAIWIFTNSQRTRSIFNCLQLTDNIGWEIKERMKDKIWFYQGDIPYPLFSNEPRLGRERQSTSNRLFLSRFPEPEISPSKTNLQKVDYP